MAVVVPPLRPPQEKAPPDLRRGGRPRPAGRGIHAALLAVLLGSAFPLYWSFLMASQTQEAVSRTPPPVLPGGHLPENVHRVFEQTDFARAMANSLLVAGATTVSVVFFSVPAGFAFARLRFPGRRGLMLFVVVTMLVPPQLGIVPLYILMTKIGWAGHLYAVIVPSTVSAFGVFFMRQYLAGALPAELVEAARVDGCSTARLLWHVVFPASRPAAALLGLFTFVQSWNDFFWPLVVLTPENGTVQVALSTLASGYHEDFSLVLTGTALATLPVLLLFLGLGRQVLGGFTSWEGGR